MVDATAKGPLVYIPKFKVEMIRWCGMHTINLGVDLWICGGVMKKMLTYNHDWGGANIEEADKLLLAYDSFRSWCRVHKLRFLS